MVVPEVVGRTALGVRVDRAEPLVADRGLAVREGHVLRAHRAAVELGDVICVRDDVLAGPGVPAAGRVLLAVVALVVELLGAARDVLPARAVALVAAYVAAVVEPCTAFAEGATDR